MADQAQSKEAKTYTDEIKGYQSIRELAEHVRHMIDCSVSAIPLNEGKPVFEWNDLVRYLGGIMNLPTNRRLVFKPTGLSGTFLSILRSNRVKIFKKALITYSRDAYVNLLPLNTS